MSVTIKTKNEIQNEESMKDLVKRLFCKNCTDDEAELFAHVCQKTGLDPRAKQIYAIKRGNSMTIQTGIDGFRLIAERTGNYSPGRESTFTYDKNNYVTSATSYIKKRTADNTWHEVACTAYMEEYNPKQGLWGKMPRTMLAKCAEALALRKAFPAELSGLYTADEMHQADIEEEKQKPVKLQKEEPKKPSLAPKKESPIIDPSDIEMPSEEDILLTEEQCSQIDLLLLEVKNRKYHEDKLNTSLEIDSFYNAPAMHYERIVRYLNNVIDVQISQEKKNETSVA